jgi:ABC-type polysaccharide/polyol phosphate transport system ATPase subunit
VSPPERAGEPAVVVEDLAKTFRVPHEHVHTLKERVLHPLKRWDIERFDALKGVSFEAERGDFFGVVGQNGSGKSTLLKCLAGIYQADAGAMWTYGRVSAFIELGVGFNPDLAARDNVVMNGIMLGLSPREARDRYESIVEFAELEKFAQLKLKNYSSGMQVRLAFSVMTHVDADVLLIDEVLAVGDAAFQQKCYDAFERLREERRTILFVTHDMAAVNRFCNRALLLEHGEVVAIGEPLDITRTYLDRTMRRRTQEPAVGDDTPQGLRLQTDRARIVEAWTETADGVRQTLFHQGDTCTLRARVEFLEPVSNPSFAASFVNDRRQNQFVASTEVDRAPTGSFAAGETALFSLSFENSFAPGRYHVSLVVTRGTGGLDVLERWEMMFSIVVSGEHAAGGLVDLPHDIVVERAAAAELDERPA